MTVVHARPHQTLRLLLLALLLAGLHPAPASATPRRRLCVFDPAGKTGDYYRIASDWATAAAAWGVTFIVSVQTDESIATEDLLSARCDAALLTGSRARRFNRFAGTIEAIGGLPTYDDLGALIHLLASPKAASRLQSAHFETVAIFPAGHLYLLFRDRKDASIEAFAGKRMVTLTYDPVSRAMVKTIGASMVPAEVATLGGLFNNGSADACYAPVTAIAPLELLRGVGTRGGILRLPVAQITLQVVIRRDVPWPEGFATASRRYAASVFERSLAVPRRAEAAIPDRLFIEPSPDRVRAYEAIFERARIDLRDTGVYDATMLRLMRRLRCRRDPRRAECAHSRE